MYTAKTIEQRMEDLVAAHGEVPRGAHKLQDYEARQHRDTRIQRLLGEGIVCHHVVGYQLDEKWWTFCFDRRGLSENDDEELWLVMPLRICQPDWHRGWNYRWAREEDAALGPIDICE